MRRTLVRIAHEIVETQRRAGGLAIVGIHRRGAVLADRLQRCSASCSSADVPLGDVDISFYRDDLGRALGRAASSTPPTSTSTSTARTVVIVDDVLYTGRTVRAAIEALFDYGRPAASSSPCSPTAATASCRSGPTTSARTCPTARSERVNVRVEELDGVDEVDRSPTPRGTRAS